MEISEYLKFGAALAIVLALIFGIAIFLRHAIPKLKRSLTPSSSVPLSIIAQLNAGPHHKLLVVRWNEREYLALLGTGCLGPLGKAHSEEIS